MVIKRRSLRAQIREELLRRLRDGSIEAGAGINEAELANELGVSRTPLREALIGLETEGYIESEIGKGFRFAVLGSAEFEELAPVIAALECLAIELTPAERQRFYPKFNVEGLLRADSPGRAAFYSAMINNGVLTRDEVRELEDREPMGGNAAVLTVQSAMTPLDSIGQAADANKARAALRAFLGYDDDPAPRD